MKMEASEEMPNITAGNQTEIDDIMKSPKLPDPPPVSVDIEKNGVSSKQGTFFIINSHNF